MRGLSVHMGSGKPRKTYVSQNLDSEVKEHAKRDFCLGSIPLLAILCLLSYQLFAIIYLFQLIALNCYFL